MAKTQTVTRIDERSRWRVAVSEQAADEGPKQSLVEQAYDELRKRILDNVYPPGHQALEAELALQLGISRTPVREALIRLEQEGLVEIIPRHGVRILPVSPAVMREIYEILTALESMAAELVASRRPSEEELQPLVQASKDMAKALRVDDLDAWAEADERFHRHLIELAGNKLLVQTVLNFWDRAHRARMVTLRLRRKPVNSTKEHMDLVEMIRKGDAHGAVEVNRAHRQRASRELLEIFERYRFSQL
ncbi:MAG: GntR family transcriptional regulator [Blastocatellia bacterium]